MPAPLKGKRRPDKSAFTPESMRLLSIIDRKTKCWNWGMSVNKDGYGQARHMGLSFGAHRLMFMLIHPHYDVSGRLICHTCDNRRCINPEHLYAGTHKSNMRDMISRGRDNFVGCPSGERHKDAKLTEKKVIAIRARNNAGEGYRVLAKAYGVDRTTIKNIVKRVTWKHLP